MRKLLYIILTLLPALSIAQGTIKVNTPFDRNNPNDNTNVAFSNGIQGAPQIFATITDRDNFTTIHSNTIVVGNDCKVLSPKGYYEWNGTVWVAVVQGKTQAQIDSAITANLANENLQVVATRGNSYTGRLLAQGFNITGTSGNGYSFFPSQSSMPATPTGGFNLFADATGRFSWKSPLGFTRTIASTALTADRVYNFADASYTVPGLELANIFTANQSISYNGSPKFSLNNPVTGSNTDFNQLPTLNEFNTTVKAKQAGGTGGAVNLVSASSQSISMAASWPTGAAPFTVATWFSRTSGTSRVLLTNNTTTSGQIIAISTDAIGGIQVTHGGSTIASGTALPFGVYVFVCYQFDGVQGRLSINNVVAGGAVTISSPNIGSSTLLIGRSGTNAQFLDGRIDQTIIYSRTITDAERTNIYNDGYGTPSIPTSGLIRRFDYETSSTLLLDGISNTNATGTNAPGFTSSGKVAQSSSAGLADVVLTRNRDGFNFGEAAVQDFGDARNIAHSNFNGRYLAFNTPAGVSGQLGANGLFRFGYNNTDLRDPDGNVAYYGATFDPGNTTNIGSIVLPQATTLPTFSAAKAGTITNNGQYVEFLSTTNRDSIPSLRQIRPLISGYAVPQSRTITINGTTFDLSANRSWTVAGGDATLAGFQTFTARKQINDIWRYKGGLENKGILYQYGIQYLYADTTATNFASLQTTGLTGNKNIKITNNVGASDSLSTWTTSNTWHVTRVTGSYTANPYDSYIEANTASSGVAVSLAAVSDGYNSTFRRGQEITVSNIGTGTNNVTVGVSSGGTIDGDATKIIIPGETVTFQAVSDGYRVKSIGYRGTTSSVIFNQFTATQFGNFKLSGTGTADNFVATGSGGGFRGQYLRLKTGATDAYSTQDSSIRVYGIPANGTGAGRGLRIRNGDPSAAGNVTNLIFQNTQTSVDVSFPAKSGTVQFTNDIIKDNVLTKSTNYTVVVGDFQVGFKTTLDIYVDASAGNVTITLPAASTFQGYTIYVTKTDASANTVTIFGLLGGNVLSTQYQSKQSNTDGVNWYNH